VLLAVSADPNGPGLPRPLPIQWTVHPAQGQGWTDKGAIECLVDGEATVTIQPPADLPDGKYILDASFALDGNSVTVTRHFYKRTYPWLGAGLGASDKVIPPWSAISVEGNAIAVWGRRYELSPQHLPAQVVNQGQAMLAGPIRLSAQASGNLIELAASGPHEFVERTETRAVHQGKLSAGALTMTVETAIEFDGLLTVDLLIAGADKAGLDSLALDVPIRAEWAKYLLAYSQGSTICKAVPAGPGLVFDSARDAKPAPGQKGSFVPYVYLGNESGGLAWFADSDQGYVVADDQPIVTVARDGNVVRLHIRMVDQPIRDGANRRIRFCLQAAPVKPLPQGHRAITFLSEGVNTPHLWWEFGSSHWSKGCNRLVEPKHETMTLEQVRRELASPAPAMAWQAGGSSTHYVPVNVVNGATPEYESFRVEWGDSIYHDYDPADCQPLAKPDGYGSTHPLNEALGDSPSALSPSMIDYRAWCYARLLAAKRTQGLMLVNCQPVARYAPQAGFGYLRADGHRQPTYDLLAKRELLKRLAVLAHQAGMPIIPQSVGDGAGSLVPLGAFAMVNSSRVMLNRSHWRQPELLHARLGGRPYGLLELTGTIWQTTGEAGAAEHLAVALVNDFRGFDIQETEMARRADNVLQAFGVADPNCCFVPYWDANSPIRTDSPDAPAALYLRPDKALIVVTNFTDKPSVRLEVDRKGTGLAGKAIHDPERGLPVTPSADGIIDLSIPPGHYRMIWVGDMPAGPVPPVGKP
jgi:hypothetical protein